MLKINKRETVLLIVLLLAVIGYLIYHFAYVPKKAEMTALETELEISRNDKITAETQIAAIPKLEEEITVAEVTAYKGAPLFFYDIIQENLIVMLSEMAAEAPLNIISYGFSMPTVSTITTTVETGEGLDYYLKQLVEGYTAKYESALQENVPSDEGASGNAGSDASNQVAKTSVNISFSGTYHELMSYLKILEDYEKEIVVSSISISGSGGDSVSGSMTLDFYVLPKLFPNESDLAYLEWKNDLPKGKDNPFSGGGQSVNFEAQTQEERPQAASQPISYKDPDFFMIARSATSDMPTMTIGTGGDTTGETYIRDTVDGVENVTVELTGRDGKYYYSFKTDKREYSANGSKEFMPVRNDAIHFIIYSRKRVSDKDTNTINLTVINNTGLKLNIAVDGDDKTRPRVNVTTR